jgi:hypothetical protein
MSTPPSTRETNVTTAERKAGQFLKEMAEKGERQTQGGDKKSKLRDATLIPKKVLTRDASISPPADSPHAQPGKQKVTVIIPAPPTLKELGVEKTQAHRWKRLVLILPAHLIQTLSSNQRPTGDAVNAPAPEPIPH